MTCTIRQVDAAEARAFWLQQDDARIFLHPDVLEPMCARVDWWMADWNTHPVCLWPVCQAFDGSFRPPELAAYVGPLWDDALRAHKPHRWWTITSQVQQAFLSFLSTRYDAYVFELPPGTQDLRWLQWCSQDPSATHSITIEPRHTALIGRGQDGTEVVENFSRNRLKDLRRLQQLDYRECLEAPPSTLVGLYRAHLASKGQGKVAERRGNELINLLSAAAAGFGRIIAYGHGDADPSSFILLLGTRATAIAVVMASSSESRSQGVQALLHLEAIRRSFDSGVSTFDLAGGNSRLGAEEKHRYGGWPAMYFRIRVSAR